MIIYKWGDDTLPVCSHLHHYNDVLGCRSRLCPGQDSNSRPLHHAAGIVCDILLSLPDEHSAQQLLAGPELYRSKLQL